MKPAAAMKPDAQPPIPLDVLHRGLVETLGITFTKVDVDEVIATMPVTPRHHQPFGVLHGGASVVLAESIASVGGTLNCGPDQAAFGMEINANHIRSVRDGIVRGVGIPLHRGRTTQVWEIKLYDVTERLICVSRCTLAVVDRT
ncbi:MAG: PaaI family thioesterase [Rhodothermales bacterium]